MITFVGDRIVEGVGDRWTHDAAKSSSCHRRPGHRRRLGRAGRLPWKGQVTRMGGRKALRTGRPLRIVAIGMTVVLAAGFATAPAAQADPRRSGRPEVADRTRTVDGKNLKVRPRTPDPAAGAARTARAAWPRPGTAVVKAPGRQAARSGSAEGLERAKGLPVALAAPGPAAEGAAARPALEGPVDVTVLDRRAAGRAGVDGLMFTLAPADQGASGRVGVRLDYSSFAQAFGGSYGTRLRLARLPACALTTPARPECRTSVPVPTANDGEKRTLAADVDTADASGQAAPTVLAAVAAPEGSQGDYTATKLEPSATWTASGSTGDFTWSYPVKTPPVPGGLTPGVTLSYSAQSVDGRTVNTNSQPSWAGEGFDFWPGFIEQRYKSCADDGAPKDAQGNTPGDLCWGYENATVTWNGKGGELIKAADGSWRLKNDDGTRFERLASSDTGNGDHEGEYWKVTTTDGTQYFFGRNHLPGYGSGGPETNSAWTVPVFGDDAGEPCHKDSGFAESWCQQAWRWNLDMIVDPDDNAAIYLYDKETNHYARNLRPADATPYTRGGYLKSVEYGLRGANVFAGAPPARVLFETSERCIPDASFDCDPAKISANPAQWPDVPWDMNCEAGTECKDGHGSTSPTFWSRKRLTKITTQVNRGSGWPYRDVASWTLAHRWGAETDERDLLLEGIQHTGLAGPQGAEKIALPKVTFNHVAKANRLDQAGDGLPPYTRYRVSKIFDEVGGELDVAYSGADCTRAAPPTPESNTRRCFPTVWHAPGSSTPITDWFHKYVVTSIVQKDRTGRSPDMATEYGYLGGAAWHYDDDDGLTREKYKTWSQWRGYGQVRVTSGAAGAPTAQTDTYYLRGMHGDRAGPDGGAKTVTVPDGEGGVHTDAEGLDGFTLKTVDYLAPGGSVHQKAVNVPWRHQTAIRERSWGTVTANAVLIDNSRTWTALDGGAWRQTKTASVYETDLSKVGRVKQVDDLGDVSIASDDKCTRTEYADNVDKWMVSYKARVETVSVACATTPERPKHVVSDERTFYDNGAFQAPPTRGDVTLTEKVAGYDGSTARYVTDKKSTYDAFGRTLTESNALGQTTTTRYTDTAGLTTKTTKTTPPAVPGNAATALTTTEELDPAWGEPTAKVDNANNLRTTLTRDAFGRLDTVWLPNRPKNDQQPPSLKFDYQITDGRIVAVTTRSLTAAGGQRTSTELFDGWLRSRQTQEPRAGGRLVSDTFYDDRGKVAKKYSAYPAAGAPSTDLFGVDSPGDVATQTLFSYDGLGRTTLERFVTGSGSGQERWRTTTTYGGNWKAVDPPAGGTPTAEITDARGRVVERRQYSGPAPTGGYDATTYAYDGAGRVTKVTDPSGNMWTDEYDLLGRKVKISDPSKGTTTRTYDDAGNLVTSTDARDRTVHFGYDGLGRKTEVRADSATGARLASWTYDTATRGKGLPAAATRHGERGDYTTTTSSYDPLGRAESTTYTVPAAEGALAGSYTFTKSYNLDGTVKEEGLPAAGGLPAETLRRTYDDDQNATRLTSDLGTYVGLTEYTPIGQQKLVELGESGKRVWSAYEWEAGTQRLKSSRTYREGVTGDDRNASYRYDDSGNILSISDASSAGTDNQCFQYDYLRRLTEAWTEPDADCSATPAAGAVGGPAPYWQTLTYDKAGNRKTETRHGLAGGADTLRTYTYADPGKGNQLDRVVQTGGAGARTDAFEYDAAGGTTRRARGAQTQTLDWDTEGRLAKVTEGAAVTEFVYDAEGNRLMRRETGGATLYLPGTELRLTGGAAASAGTRYYTHNDQTVAVRTPASLNFLAGDHQGTSQVAVNAADRTSTVRRFTPFGDLRAFPEDATWPGERGFVGGVRDPTGLTHLGVREYDSETGRFLSVDPIMDLADPQQMNGYAYAGNSPVTLSDPDGQHPCDPGSPPSCMADYARSQAENIDRERRETTRDHDIVVRDTVGLIKKRMKEMGITGRITIAKRFNKIPGGARDGSGGTGYADIILWTDDAVYVWEVKARGGNTKINGEWISNKELGPIQLRRYITELQKKLQKRGDDRQVERGFGLESGTSISTRGEVMRTWSGADDGEEEGLRYYAYQPKPKRQPQEQEQEQEVPQPAPNPCIVAAMAGPPCGGGPVPIVPGVPGVPAPRVPVPSMPRCMFPQLGCLL
ncbi:RHS repeat-associated core domain-containing protein [Actinomadura sp. NPDC048955]|uniref:RHS repeat-associated core domain-containing protein n=1 Tax=Actinomadura sp. NPDC048955 TaxID=3158228 RepID=UPI0033D6E2C9